MPRNKGKCARGEQNRIVKTCLGGSRNCCPTPSHPERKALAPSNHISLGVYLSAPRRSDIVCADENVSSIISSDGDSEKHEPFREKRNLFAALPAFPGAARFRPRSTRKQVFIEHTNTGNIFYDAGKGRVYADPCAVLPTASLGTLESNQGNRRRNRRGRPSLFSRKTDSFVGTHRDW